MTTATTKTITATEAEKKEEETTRKKLPPRTGGRGSEHREERRDKSIRLRASTYERLAERAIYKMRDDFDDIVSRLLDKVEEMEAREEK